MLSREIEHILDTLDDQIAAETLSVPTVEVAVANLRDIAARLADWELAATPGPAARLEELADNVIRLDAAREGRDGPAGGAPPGDVA